MATTLEYINQLKEDKKNLVSMLNNMGVEASDSESFTSLAPKVGTIVTEPNLQDKEVTITENTTTSITPDEGFNGLNSVNVVTNIPSSGGGETPEKGIIIKSFDENGRASDIEIVGLTTIPDYFFCNGSNQSSTASVVSDASNIKLPNNITSIGDYAFQYNFNLETINLPETITEIGAYAFRNNMKLKLDKLPRALIEIPEYCFTSCSELALEELPENLISIGNMAFNGCKALVVNELPNTLTVISASAFYNCTSLKIKEIPASVITIGQNAFQGAGIEELTFSAKPSSVTANIFNGMKSLAKLIWNSELTATGANMFYNCTALKEVIFNTNVLKTINGATFANNTSLISVALPDTVTTITGSNANTSGATCGAFYGDTSLKAIWIGNSVTNSGMQRYAFYKCTALEKMFINLPRATVEAMTNYSYAFMNDTSKTGIIICNDDEGFLSKEQFDVIDWATYTD